MREKGDMVVQFNLATLYREGTSVPKDFKTAATATYTMEITSIQLAYSMGGMTLSLSQDSAENSDYVQNQDEKETLVSVSMAF